MLARVGVVVAFFCGYGDFMIVERRGSYVVFNCNCGDLDVVLFVGIVSTFSVETGNRIYIRIFGARDVLGV